MGYGQLMEYVVEAKGRLVLVDLWATWCGPCLKELPDLMKLRTDFPEDRLDIIAISLDYDPSALEKYLKENPLNFPNYLAAPDLMELLNIRSIPRLLVFDFEGHQVGAMEGYTPVEELRPMLEALLNE